MIQYQPLTQVDFHQIQQCFVKAFSDYQVQIDMPPEKLQLMLGRRGFVPELSIGALAGDELVGLILNGRRVWSGRDTIYDTGTGVIPEYRRQGITNAMFLEVLKLCKNLGIRQYLLEVLNSNTPAVELYQKQGFKITRTFSCYKGPKAPFSGGDTGHTATVSGVGQLDWEVLRAFWNFEPSWQNSIDSIMAVPEEFAVATVIQDGQMIGYGVVEKRTGDIPQLAVAQGFRGRGIGREILCALAQHVEAAELRIINIEDGHPAIDRFLERNGFENLLGQYEMVLEL